MRQQRTVQEHETEALVVTATYHAAVGPRRSSCGGRISNEPHLPGAVDELTHGTTLCIRLQRYDGVRDDPTAAPGADLAQRHRGLSQPGTVGRLRLERDWGDLAATARLFTRK